MVLKVTGRSLPAFAYGALTSYGRPFRAVRLTGRFFTPLGPCRDPAGPYNPRLATTAVLSTRRVWAVPLSLATTQGMFSLPGGTKMFQFPPFPRRLCAPCPGIPPGGFPHSEISGSQPAHGSPKLIAVNHVLHRPLAPRHPPCALSSLIRVMRRTEANAFYSALKVPPAADESVAHGNCSTVCAAATAPVPVWALRRRI